MSPVANPIVEGVSSPVAANAPQPNAPPPTSGPAAQLPSGFTMGTFSHPDNTSTHVAILVAGAFAVVAFFYWGGFKFAVDVGATRG